MLLLAPAHDALFPHLGASPALAADGRAGQGHRLARPTQVCRAGAAATQRGGGCLGFAHVQLSAVPEFELARARGVGGGRGQGGK